ncbi:hypothetical protein M501DRAFT_1007842 [Patellaria atrata CBS 101060]|uniref:Double-strand-break repair protein rad21 n=1 Tax=Patellaria atrata CBS 101060 TaxID=1346257 RepID=A0A9P4S4W5_9PEZI|nr:hypothetical protein M501DRAFT_1007842 [Patellaria atrata CBS 101060]
MFYSETLLSKTGPLARVWLAANLERKLSKSNILQSNIESSVGAIMDQGQAPMALRLSGQLLLGVVRIYSRKARYLLDDCNEALMKIKLAFRPGNVDLPAEQSHTANPASLTLPDTLTEADLLAPLMDPSLLLSQDSDIDLTRPDPNLLDLDSSQYLSGSIEQGRAHSSEPQLLEDDLGLELDLGDGPTLDDISIEKGREAPAPRTFAEEMDESTRLYDGDDLELDLGDTELAPRSPSALPQIEDPLQLDVDDDVVMGGADNFHFLPEDTEHTIAQTPRDRERDSLSPLSELRPSVERELEESFHPDPNNTTVDAEEEELSVHQAHKAKRRKVLEADTNTEIGSTQIRAQQNDRSHILKSPSFLPRDPMLLALMNMQKTGGFVSNILGDGRSQGWAPELRGILSLEVVRRSRDLKRKRDSGVADMDDEEDAESRTGKTPQLEIEEDEVALTVAPPEPASDNNVTSADGFEDEPPAPPEEELGSPPVRAESEEALSPLPDNFDDTTMPLLHPADSGPVSLGTKHAVHLLRERFGESAADSPSQRQKTSVLFQEMLPEDTTTKSDATKMFFECLVLATKDAIKVEQSSTQLGGPLRIRAKRGLWGSWAETSAGGEIASQVAPATVEATS